MCKPFWCVCMHTSNFLFLKVSCYYLIRLVATTPGKTLNKKNLNLEIIFNRFFVKFWSGYKKKLPPPSMTTPDDAFLQTDWSLNVRDRDLKISNKIDFLTFCGLGYIKFRSNPPKGPWGFKALKRSKWIGAGTERDRDFKISDKVDFITFCG